MKDWLPPPPTQARNPGFEGGILTPSTKKGENGLSQQDYFGPSGAIERIADARVRYLQEQRKLSGKELMSEQGEEMVKRLIKVGLSRQCAISPALIDPTYGDDAPAPKIDETVKQLKAHFNGGWGKNGEPAVVFSSSVKSFQLLKRKLKQAGVDVDNMCGEISNNTSTENRAYIQDAANEGKIKIVFVGIKSGGAGLNLQKAANHEIFLDRPWTAADLKQAIARVQRPKQQKNVLMTSWTMDGTYDPIVEEKVASKEVMSEALFGDDDTWMDEADNKIKAMMGGVSPKSPKFSGEHDSQFAKIAQALNGGEFDDDAMKKLLGNKDLSDVEVNKKARKELSPHLTAEFDQAADRKSWRQKRADASLNSRIAGMEALVEVMKKQLDAKDPKVKKNIEDINNRLKNLKAAQGGKPGKDQKPVKHVRADEKAEKDKAKQEKKQEAAKKPVEYVEENLPRRKSPKTEPKVGVKNEKPKSETPSYDEKAALPKFGKHKYNPNSKAKRHGVAEAELAAAHEFIRDSKAKTTSELVDALKEAGAVTGGKKEIMKVVNKWMAAFHADGAVK